MNRRQNQSNAFRASRTTLIAGLLVCAFFVRALIPVGFMPSFGGDMPLVLCTAQGTVTLPVAGDAAGHPAHAQQECPFAFALAMAAAPLAVAALELPFTADLLLVERVVRQADSQAPSHYSARAPPFLV